MVFNIHIDSNPFLSAYNYVPLSFISSSNVKIPFLKNARHWESPGPKAIG